MLVGADIEEFLAAFLADLDAVAAALELSAEAADVFAGWIEDEDGGVVFEFLASLVDDLDIAL